MESKVLEVSANLTEADGQKARLNFDLRFFDFTKAHKRHT